MGHWSDRYFGRAYIPDVYDCAHLVEEVQREIFCREIRLPHERPAVRGPLRLRAIERLVEGLKGDFARPTDTPLEGDGVILMSRGRLSHIGVYYPRRGEPWVLHNLRSAGEVCRHRVRSLARLNLAVEGYYAWL